MLASEQGFYQRRSLYSIPEVSDGQRFIEGSIAGTLRRSVPLSNLSLDQSNMYVQISLKFLLCTMFGY